MVYSGLVSASFAALALGGLFGVTAAVANDKLIELSKSDDNWACRARTIPPTTTAR